MKRRLTIARALINDPRVLLLDEPTTGLDPQARHILWDRLFRLKEQGTTLLLTTHYMDEAEQLCDRLVVVDKGRIMAEGTPADAHPPATPRARCSRCGSARERNADIAEQLAGIGDRLEVLPDRILVYSATTARPSSSASPTRGLHPLTSLVRRSSLEDVFLRLTGRTPDRMSGILGRAAPKTRSDHSEPSATATRARGRAHPRRWGAWYVAEHRLPRACAATPAPSSSPASAARCSTSSRSASVWRRSSTAASAPSAVGGVSYLVFVAPALLASAAITVASEEFTYPIMLGFKWNPTFSGMHAAPLQPQQIADGVILSVAVRMLVNTVLSTSRSCSCSAPCRRPRAPSPSRPPCSPGSRSAPLLMAYTSTLDGRHAASSPWSCASSCCR